MENITENNLHILEHYQKYFGKEVVFQFNRNKSKEYLNTEYCICIFQPNENRNMLTYSTNGLSLKNQKRKNELVFYAPKPNDQAVDILLAISDYHISGEMIGLNHTVNFGIPVAEKSDCKYGLISMPYIEKEDFFKSDDTYFLWVIPITEKEKEFKVKDGIEKLEERFEKKNFNYLDFYRKSVI